MKIKNSFEEDDMTATNFDRVKNIISRYKAPYTSGELQEDPALATEIISNTIEMSEILNSFQDEFSLKSKNNKRSSIYNYVDRLVKNNSAERFYFRADGSTPLTTKEVESEIYKNKKVRIGVHHAKTIDTTSDLTSLGITFDCSSKFSDYVYTGQAEYQKSKKDISLISTGTSGELFSLNIATHKLLGTNPTTIFITQGKRSIDRTTRLAVDVKTEDLKMFGDNIVVMKHSSPEIYPQRLLVEDANIRNRGQIAKLQSEEKSFMGPSIGHVAISIYNHRKSIVVTNMGPSDSIQVCALNQIQAEDLIDIKHWLRFGVKWPNYPKNRKKLIEEFPTSVSKIEYQEFESLANDKLPTILPSVLIEDTWIKIQNKGRLGWVKDACPAAWTQFLIQRSAVIKLPCLIKINSESFLIA